MKKHKFCPEFQAYYDSFAKKPPMKLCIATDKKIRKYIKAGQWAEWDRLFFFDTENEEDALINWANPQKV